jgi:hypothetical protein
VFKVKGVDVFRLFGEVVQREKEGEDVGGDVWLDRGDVPRFRQILEICAAKENLSER